MAYMTIVITGGSGFIGSELSKRLVALHHTVLVVDIKPPKFTHETLFFISCDTTDQPLPYGILEKTDSIINLVGKGIFSRWTLKRKHDIERSRIESTRHIVESIATASIKPMSFISASALGYYGDTGDSVVDEQSLT